MKYLIPMLILFFSLALPASALEITAPEVPVSGAEVMPENTESFAGALAELLQRTILRIRPDLAEASKVGVTVIAAVMMITVLSTFSGPTKKTAVLAGTITIAAVLLSNTNAMITLGSDTVRQLSDYGKLLFPVMTAAMAAQGGVTASAALYTGTET